MGMLAEAVRLSGVDLAKINKELAARAPLGWKLVAVTHPPRDDGTGVDTILFFKRP
jgi:hypothetical protein